MSEKLFKLNDKGSFILEDGEPLKPLGKVVDLLNEQQSTIIKQDEEIRKLKRTERSWRRIHCCNKESDNCGIVIEQQTTISDLEKENEELREQNKKLEAEKEYWEQSSKHRQRLLEDSEKELRLHNAYLIDNNQAEDYQRWRRSNK